MARQSWRAAPETAASQPEHLITDNHFVEAFENCTLPEEQVRHTDDVRMGFLYVSRYPGLEGVRRFSEGLERYAAALGKTNLYHETITWAFLLLIRERLARKRQHDGVIPTWDEFAAANSDLLTWNDHLLRKYYTDETLQSELARKTFVLPDRNLVLSSESGALS